MLVLSMVTTREALMPGVYRGAKIDRNVASETGGNLQAHIQIIVECQFQIGSAGNLEQRHLRVTATGRAGKQSARHRRAADLRGRPAVKISIRVPFTAAPVIRQWYRGINGHRRGLN